MIDTAVSFISLNIITHNISPTSPYATYKDWVKRQIDMDAFDQRLP